VGLLLLFARLAGIDALAPAAHCWLLMHVSLFWMLDLLLQVLLVADVVRRHPLHVGRSLLLFSLHQCAAPSRPQVRGAKIVARVRRPVPRLLQTYSNAASCHMRTRLRPLLECYGPPGNEVAAVAVPLIVLWQPGSYESPATVCCGSIRRAVLGPSTTLLNT
jgi:hypothetical protein